MKFSVLVPVYNVEKYLEECLNSILNQTFTDFELVLVDDGSTDSCAAICDVYKNKYNQIKVIHQENAGLMLARRRGIKEATGEYFVFVDSDDFVKNNLLESLNKIIDENHPDMVIYNAVKYFSSGKTGKHKDLLFDNDRFFANDKKQIYDKLMNREMSNTMWTKAVNRRIVDIENDYSCYGKINLGEDLIQILPLLTNANSIYYTTQILYYYRTNPFSITKQFKIDNYQSIKKVNTQLDKYILDWGEDTYSEKAAYRFMHDVYDLFTQIATSSKETSKIQCLRYVSDDQYFKEKYRRCEISQLGSYKKLVINSIKNNNIICMEIYMHIYKFGNTIRRRLGMV